MVRRKMSVWRFVLVPFGPGIWQIVPMTVLLKPLLPACSRGLIICWTMFSTLKVRFTLNPDSQNSHVFALTAWLIHVMLWGLFDNDDKARALIKYVV